MTLSRARAELADKSGPQSDSRKRLAARKAIAANADARIARTRKAVISAFNAQLFEHGYDAIQPGSLAEAAGVGRSTFYEHFGGKSDVLRSSLVPILTPLATAVTERNEDMELRRCVDHFWAQRAIARVLMTGRSRGVIQTQLADLIASQLRGKSYRTRVPLQLVATQVAHAQLAALDEWLAGRHRCDSEMMTHVLRTGAVSLCAGFSI